MAELLEQIGRLDRRELLALIREAAAQLERLEENEWELSPAQQEEMRRRLLESERDGHTGDDWPTVRAHIVAQAELNQAAMAATEAVAA